MGKNIIIGISGKKQAGKDTVCNFLSIYLNNKYHYKHNCCKSYSFADSLKEKICMGVMGLTYEQCYGTDEEKNTLTSYKWDNLPDNIRFPYSSSRETGDIISIRTGFMTAREIMQVVGTNIFRAYFDDSIWVNATLRNIKEDNCDFALISDVRFPSEVEGIIKNNGYVFRLLRDICESDCHESEVALDNYNWNSNKDNIFIIDNSKMSIDQQNQKTEEIACRLITNVVN